MPEDPLNAKEMGFYLSLGQVGMEMVVPIVVGLIVDHYLNWSPWGVIVGAVLGFFGGLAHLIQLLNQHENAGPSSSKRDAP